MKKQIKKTKKKDNSKNQLLFAIIAVALIIALAGGGTYAYWSWQSGTGQNTTVSVTVAGANLLISGGNVSYNKNSGQGLYPTNDCDGAGALISDVATVKVANETESSMNVTLYIRGAITAESTAKQNLLTTTNKGYLKWAIVETSSGTITNSYCQTQQTATTTYTCSSPIASGNLSTITYTNTTLSTLNSSATSATITTGADIATGITFEVPGIEYDNSGATSTGGNACIVNRTYKIYVWLDDGYSYTNYGDYSSTSSDPMQNLDVKVMWSPASSMTQNPN